MKPLTTNCPAFRGKFAFLSNFHSCKVVYEGIGYPSSEHAFMSGKTLDQQEKLHIASLKTPGAAKRYGRTIKLRPDWEEVKFKVMEDVLRIKFSDPELRKRLLETNGYLIEERVWWHDLCWGACYCDRCNGKGENNLGKILMKIRDEEFNTKIKGYKDLLRGN